MLLERERELVLMADLLAGVESSGGKVVLIRGEPGIGKSSLVKEFAERHADEADLLFGSCDDLLIPQPLGPFWDIAREEPSLAEALYSGDRPGVLAGTLDVLSRSLRPSVVVIEDTQWADEATLDAIKYVGRRIARTKGLLLLTYRDGEVDYDHPLRGVIGDLPPDSVVRVQLGGLSLSAVSSIVREAGLDSEQVLAATGGNPYLVTEMASADGEAIPSSVQDSVMVRVQKLSPQAHQMLKILSVIPEAILISDAVGLTGALENQLAECERRGLLDVGSKFVGFRHELVRRAIEDSLSGSERVATNRTILEFLPPETDPARLVHHAREANDVVRLVELAPRAARAAAAVGSHREAVNHFRQLTAHLDRLESDLKGPILDEWAHEESVLDNLSESINLIEMALLHYRKSGDRRAESGALCEAARTLEYSGQRDRAEQLARQAVDVLGTDPDGSDLARALEVNAHLAMMAGDISTTRALVDRTLAVAKPSRDELIIVRSLIHRGLVGLISDYPEGGLASLNEARDRSVAAGLWHEEARTLANRAWAAAEFRDLPAASDYAQRAVASSRRHEAQAMESYAHCLYARVKDLKAEWSAAEDIARGQLEGPLNQMVSLPIIGIIEARTGRATARATLTKAWEVSSSVNEFQRLGPAAARIAEYAWMTGIEISNAERISEVMVLGLDHAFEWSPGSIALWLWKLGEITDAPEGIAEPYRLLIEGEPMAAAEMWSEIGCPYERAIALAHGDEAAQRDALDVLETLGATAVAGKLRKAMRDQGLSVPRGKGRTTRSHVAGLTARQDEVLQLLDEGLSNTEIADRLFVSPRTVENHVAAVLSKLDASTREEAASVARSEGLIDVG